MSAVPSHTDQPPESVGELVFFFIPHQPVHGKEKLLLLLSNQPTREGRCCSGTGTHRVLRLAGLRMDSGQDTPTGLAVLDAAAAV